MVKEIAIAASLVLSMALWAQRCSPGCGLRLVEAP